MSTITREQAQKIIEAADEIISALAGTNEDVHPDNCTKMVRLYDDLNDHYAPPEVVRELARIALASLEAEPTLYCMTKWGDLDPETASTSKAAVDAWAEEWNDNRSPNDPLCKTVPLYTDPPAPVVPDEMAIFDDMNLYQKTSHKAITPAAPPCFRK